MKLICGLGNPGPRYENTRHNAGFLFVDALAKEQDFPPFSEEKLAWVTSKGQGSDKVILIKPKTFMNESGLAVVHYLSFYKIPLEDLCVVYDDVDLPLGSLRFREEGSAGTHNGMKSIIQHAGSQKFPRLRLGVESRGTFAPEQMDLASFVLAPFSAEERELFDAELQEALVLLKNSLA